MQKILAWITILTLAVGVVAPERAHAAVNAGVLFLRIAAGARAAGMGETFVAVANDASATHWNPAGLGDYPLNNEWEDRDLLLPDGATVLDAVAVRNDLPYENYAAYDLWILTDKGLVTVEARGEGASRSSQTIPTLGFSSVAAAVRRYMPFLTEDEADDIARGVASAMIGVPLDELEPLLGRVGSSIPEGYKDRTIVENSVRGFRAAYREGRLDRSGLTAVREVLQNLPESGTASPEDLDRARFALERSVTGVIPDKIVVPFRILFPPPVRAIAGDGKALLVAAGDRLLKYSGDRWDLIVAPEGSDWTAEGINCLAVTGGGTLWVGTDNGLLTGRSGSWTRYTTAEGLPSARVTKIAMRGARNGWVLTDNGLAQFNGETFNPNAKLTANIDADLSSMVARFINSEDSVAIAVAVETVRTLNGLDADYVPAAGATIEVPVGLGIRGDITALDHDSYGRLWVGSTLGTTRYWQGRWAVFGYTQMVASEATTASAIAEQKLGERATSERIENFARIIREFNNLGADGRIDAGRTFYVYRNPAASRVYDFGDTGDRLLIASSAGQLEVRSGDWSRYYHADLERDQVRAIVSHAGEAWFVTDSRVVVYKHSRKEVTFMHSAWLPEFNLDLYYDYASYVTHVEGWGTIGAAVTFFSYGEIIRTDEFGRLGNSFHSFDGAFSLSYGTRLSPNLVGGLTAKVVYSRLADQGAGAEIGSGSATAFALDAGLIYRTPWDNLTLGVAITNVGPDISYIDAQQSDPLPRNLAVGLAYKIFNTPYNKLTFLGDINKEIVNLDFGNSKSSTFETTSEFKQIIYNVGLEYWYGSFVALRTGYIYDEDGDIKTPTLGGGLSYRQIQMDVAYIPSTRDTPLANTTRWSITGRF